MNHTTPVLAVSLLFAAAALGQVPAISDSDLPYWPTDQRAAYADYESALNAVPSPDRLRAFHDLVASKPHIASTQGDLDVVDAIAATFESFGLTVERHPFWAYISLPVDAALEIVTPEPIAFDLKENPLPEDPYSGLDALTFGFNAFSASGDVTAQVVYANFGRKQDFEKLAEMGVSCQGKVVLCRYGGNYRGYKAKFAEEAGAAALVIYTDPAQSGFAEGPEYPKGGYLTGQSIQRGSIKTLPYAGDPLTPFIEATEDAPRLDPDEIALPRIPVQPVGWLAAEQIMSRMTGSSVPKDWAGAMKCDYRLTGGPDLTVRVMVRQDRAIRKTYNVIATLTGATEPDRTVIIGAHHDAWSCGAADSTSGIICVLETARSFATLAAQGHRPARTIKFCAWGAEEFGIIGSAEWVEANLDELLTGAVAYINLDMVAMGPNFGSSASPSLRTLIAQAARSVPQARDPARSVFDAWTNKGAGDQTAQSPSFGDMGGGSDHVSFLCHAGVPSCSLSGHGSKGSSYHTNYDTLTWYRQVVGDDYEPALMVTRMTVAVASRLASAPLLPLDPARAALEFPRHTNTVIEQGVADGFFDSAQSAQAAAIRSLDALAADRAATLAAIMSILYDAAADARLSDESLRAVNDAIMAQDRAWLANDGIPGRPWYRNTYAAPDEDSGYAAWILPNLRHAVAHEDSGRLKAAVRLYRQLLAAPVHGFDAIEPETRDVK